MSTLKFDSWKNLDGTENYKCRAWVNFDGTGTPAILDAGNVNSITDDGTGRYTLNFTTALPSNTFMFSGSAGNFGSTSTGRSVHRNGALSTTSLAIRVVLSNSNAAQDDEYIGIAIFGGDA